MTNYRNAYTLMMGNFKSSFWVPMCGVSSKALKSAIREHAAASCQAQCWTEVSPLFRPETPSNNMGFGGLCHFDEQSKERQVKLLWATRHEQNTAGMETVDLNRDSAAYMWLVFAHPSTYVDVDNVIQEKLALRVYELNNTEILWLKALLSANTEDAITAHMISLKGSFGRFVWSKQR